MTSWRCFGCRTVYPPATGTCPNCEETTVAKANPWTGSSHYVADGAAVPADLHPDVRLVGPGVVVAGEDADIPEDDEADDGDEFAEFDTSEDEIDAWAGEAGPDYDAQTILALRDVARGRGLPTRGSKAELVARLTEADKAAAA